MISERLAFCEKHLAKKMEDICKDHLDRIKDNFILSLGHVWVQLKQALSYHEDWKIDLSALLCLGLNPFRFSQSFFLDSGPYWDNVL